MDKIKIIAAVLVFLLLVFSCKPGGDGLIPDDEGDDNPPPGPVVTYDAEKEFWGNWSDFTGNSYYFSVSKLETGGGEYSYTGKGADYLVADSVMYRKIGDNSMQIGGTIGNLLFRAGGASAAISGRITGHTDGASPSVSRGFGLTGLGSIDVVISNLGNPGNTASTETDIDGAYTADEIILGDTYRIEVGEGDEAVTADITPELDGENIGILVVAETEYNFQTRFRSDDEYIYADGTEKTGRLVLENIGTADCFAGTYDFESLDSGLSINGQSWGSFTTIEPGNTREFEFNFTCAFISQDYKDFEVKMTVEDIEHNIFEDIAVVRVYDKSVTFAFSADVPNWDQNNGTKVQGILMDADGGCRTFTFDHYSSNFLERMAFITVPDRQDGYLLSLRASNELLESLVWIRTLIGVNINMDTNASEMLPNYPYISDTREPNSSEEDAFVWNWRGEWDIINNLITSGSDIDFYRIIPPE